MFRFLNFVGDNTCYRDAGFRRGGCEIESYSENTVSFPLSIQFEVQKVPSHILSDIFF